MIVVLSPAKSMCAYSATQFRATCPTLLRNSDTILTVMKGKTAKDLKVFVFDSLLSVSDIKNARCLKLFQTE